MIEVILWSDETWIYYDGLWTGSNKKGELHKHTQVENIEIKTSNVNVSL